MRILTFLSLLIALASPAAAGMRATYTAPDSPRALVVEVADNGDARIGEQGAADYGLLIGGTFYIVGGNGGALTVARIADVAAAIDSVVPPIFGDVFTRTGPPAPRAALRAEVIGKRIVGGRHGQVHAITGIDQTNPAATADFVISTDPALKPVGRALEMFMHASLLPGAVLLGTAAPELIEETRFIFALGTPIDAAGRFRLDRVEDATIAPERLALPAKPKTVAELAAAMKAGR